MSGNRVRRVALAVALLGIGGAVGAVAWASIPGSDGLISGCYDFEGAGKGKVRVIDAEAGAVCRPTEKPLDWYSATGSDDRYMNRSQFVSQLLTRGSGDNCGPNGDCEGLLTCELGGTLYQLASGGYDSIDNGTHLISSMPSTISGRATGWRVEWRNNDTEDTVRIIAVCSGSIVAGGT